MKKNLNKKIFLISSIILFILIKADTGYSATFDFAKREAPIQIGNTSIIDVYIDTENQDINVVDGLIGVEGNYKIVSIQKNEQDFILWPTTPSFSKKQINFTAGSTKNLNGKYRIISIAIIPLDSQTITLKNLNSNVYLNDGRGTSVGVKSGQNTFAVEPQSDQINNELLNNILADKKEPNKFEIELGQDNNLFDGKYFISFQASDDGSGINRYEISENGGPTVRSGTTYVLRDQSLEGEVVVRAIDNAGNVRVVKLDLNPSIWPIVGKILLGLFLLSSIIYLAWVKLKK